MDNLTSLITKLQSAEYGSRELDADISVMFKILPDHTTEDWMAGWTGPWVSFAGCVVLEHSDGSRGPNWKPQPWTTSLDAAVAFRERMLPGWGWMVYRSARKRSMLPVLAMVWPKGIGPAFVSGNVLIEPLALCIAVLKALQAKGEAL